MSERFRNTKSWQRKRAYIADRDLHMCRLCAIGYGNKLIEYNSSIEVHHIEPLCEDWSRRLDDDNLICLCHYHHELAEAGKVSRKYLHELAKCQLTGVN